PAVQAHGRWATIVKLEVLAGPLAWNARGGIVHDLVDHDVMVHLEDVRGRRRGDSREAEGAGSVREPGVAVAIPAGGPSIGGGVLEDFPRYDLGKIGTGEEEPHLGRGEVQARLRFGHGEKPTGRNAGGGGKRVVAKGVGVVAEEEAGQV